MKPKIGYDDQTVAAEVEEAYDAEFARDLRLLVAREKWERRGRKVGRILVAAAYALLFAVAVNLVHATVWAIAWIWGWWG